MNKVILIGRLTKDPDLKYTPQTSTAVATFTLAITRKYANQKGERETDFIPIVVWKKLAEQCASNLRKGRLVGVSGRLQVRAFETQNGTKRWVTEVVADEVQYLDRKKEENMSNEGEIVEEGIDIDFPEIEEDIDIEF